jgi:hypothetical protein
LFHARANHSVEDKENRNIVNEQETANGNDENANDRASGSTEGVVGTF